MIYEALPHPAALNAERIVCSVGRVRVAPLYYALRDGSRVNAMQIVYILTFSISAIVAMLLVATYVRCVLRRRNIDACPICGYITHVDGYEANALCSECGLSWSRAERMNISRGRRMLLAACVACGIAVYVGPRALSTIASVEWLPSWVLVRLAPAYDSGGELSNAGMAMRREIEKRARSGTISPTMLAHYAQRILDRLASEGNLLRCRDQWPTDIPLCIRLADASNFAPLGPVVLRVMSDDGSLLYERDSVVATSSWSDVPVVLNHATRSQKMRFVIELDSNRGQRVIMSSGHVEVQVDVVDSWRSILEPVDAPLESLLELREAFDYASRRNTRKAGIKIYKWSAYPLDLAIGFRLEIVHGDQVLSSTDYVYEPLRQGELPEYEFMGVEYPSVHYDSDLYLRIVPDPRIALRDFGNKRFWYGSPVVVPIAELSN